jgi:hypothetical protein
MKLHFSGNLQICEKQEIQLYRVIQVLPPARLTLLKISKKYEILGLHSLQTCAINFPVSPYHRMAIKFKKLIFTKKKFFAVHAHNSQLIQRKEHIYEIRIKRK